VDDRFQYNPSKVARVPAGIYEVSKDIENPNYDKRSTDFHRLPVIKAGTKVLVTDRNHVDMEHIVQPIGSRISKLNGKSSACFEAHHHCYKNLVAALVPVTEPKTEDYLKNLEHQHGYSACAEWVLQRLLNEGTVTRAQVEAAVKANAEAPEEN
jgi:hypothetical protein